ncbi:MAG: primosomal protein N' [Alphaproteobacteria bacterium]|nr:primosomal protein N' [Alphaproteobacteria bacterium]
MPPTRATSRPGPSPPEAANRRLGVLLPLPLKGPYDYRVPADANLKPGDFVAVPLGPRETTGVVWGQGSGDVAEAKLKPVAGRLEAPPLPEPVRRFIDWVAGYTLASRGAVLRMAMSVPEALLPPKPVVAYGRSQADLEGLGLRLTPARKRVLAVLADGPPRPAAELAREAGCGIGVVRGLADAGALETISMRPAAPFTTPDPARAGPSLSPSQQAAAATLRDKVAAQDFSVTLLDGVTGSGKTEVYFEAAAEALARGRQVLVLLPEIALGAQWLDRFKARFGATPAAWHSDLTRGQRRLTWRAVAEGQARVVVGARSALFLPFAELGLIVVDEEHDPAYKQEDGVIYHARDMAVVRAQITGIPVVLASATPSLETETNVATGRYDRLHLPERHGGARLPEVHVIDMRRDAPPRQRWLSPLLHAALAETFAEGEQAMLFLNRRGYAPLTLCRACGHRLACPNCTAWLVEHRLAARLQCHHCGYDTAPAETCPNCGAEHSFAACGPGVERLAEEVAADFPEARSEVVSSDTIRGPAAAEALVRRMRARDVDLLIGTQLMAKGHHFPHLTLVGVVDADLGLAGGDLRAAERTYQLLTQAAGRAGRADRPGRVYLQTYVPEHKVMAALASGDRARFMAAEAEDRHRTGMPPFGRLAALIVSGRDGARVEAAARALGRRAPTEQGVTVLGPAPAPLTLLRGQQRWRLLVKATRESNLQAVLRRWLNAVQTPAGVRVKVDVDPYSFV